MPKNAILHYKNMIEKLKIVQNNKPDDDISDESVQIIDYAC